MLYNIRNLHFSYRTNGPEVLRGVDLQIREGEILTVLGRNGAGKSTLFSCMLGMKKPRQGTVEIQGRDISAMTEREIATVVGFVPQSHNPAFSYTVEEFVLMGCARCQRAGEDPPGSGKNGNCPSGEAPLYRAQRR